MTTAAQPPSEFAAAHGCIFQVELPQAFASGVGAGGVERAEILHGLARQRAVSIVCAYHYTGSVPSGKSHYVRFGSAIIVWSIPANNNIAEFVLGWPGNVWELSRLWAPDGHEKNLLTRAISAAVDVIRKLENPDALVSYADPNVGHKGGIYRAASWIYHGRAEEVRTYRGADGKTVARRAFHSGSAGMKKAEIEAMGFEELRMPGKERFVRPLSRRARKALGGHHGH